MEKKKERELEIAKIKIRGRKGRERSVKNTLYNCPFAIGLINKRQLEICKSAPPFRQISKIPSKQIN